ncbi:MAG: FG-GAP repeat domain-containing protein [Planctomycetota bacterium]
MQDAEGLLCVLDYKGSVVMTYQGDVAFLSLDMGDMDRDGTEEIVVGDVLGWIHVLDSNGKLRWKKDVARSAIGCIAVGDINNDQKSEIVLGTHEDGIMALNRVGNLIWHVSTKLAETRKHRSARFGWIRSILVDDIDMDGRPEIVTASRPNGMISVFDGRGKRVWRKRFKKIVNNFSTSLVRIGNLTGDSKKEMVVMLHGVILRGAKGTSPMCILDPEGNMISKHEYDANFYDFCLEDLDRDGMSEILTSSSTRGRRFYVLDGYEGEGLRSNSLVLPQGDDLNDIIEKTRRSSGQVGPHPQLSQMHVLYSCRGASPHIERIHKFLSGLRAKNLAFELLIEGIHEKPISEQNGGRPGKGRHLSQDDILEMIQRFERRQIPFFLLAGAHCKIRIGLETLEKILRIAPKSCRGFVFHEDSYSSKDWGQFIDNIEKVMLICKKYGKKLILNEHQDFWYRVPMLTDIAPRFFNETFRDVLIPMYKTNRYVMPELNLGSILGLWKAGKVQQWGFSTQDDAWKWESVFMVPPDDVLLRMEVLAASLGATYFRIERGKEFLDIQGGNISLSRGTKRHRGLFHDLIRKNIIRPVYSSSQVISSPVAFQHAGARGWNGPNGPKAYWHRFYMSGLTNRIFGYQFPLQKVRDEYLPGYVYDLRYYAEAMFPKTKHGFFQIVPYWIKGESLEGIKKVWVTDGKHIFDGKKKLDGSTVEKTVGDSLQRLSETMPFGADGVFLSIQQFSNDYLIYLLDPGCLDVRGVDTVLNVNSSIRNFTISDAISKEPLSVKDRRVALRIPAGGFRILRVVLEKESGS